MLEKINYEAGKTKITAKNLNEIQDNIIENANLIDELDAKNKRQDFYINALYNENADGRLTIEDEGNDLKLLGSKQGLVEVEKVVGNTLVNIHPLSTPTFRHNSSDSSVFTVTSRENYIKITSDSVGNSTYRYIKFGNLNIPMFKPNTTYTLLFGKLKGINLIAFQGLDATGNFGQTRVKGNQKIATITTTDTIVNTGQILYLYNNLSTVSSVDMEVSDVVILEGDYTNKPIPSEYFEGMQSAFEDKLITQEMVDSGLEKAENLGKYRVDVKVVGKNLFDINKISCKSNSTSMNVNYNTITFKRVQNSATQGRLYLGKYKKGTYSFNFNSISMNATNLAMYKYEDSNNEIKRIKIREWYNNTGKQSTSFVLDDDYYISIETDGVEKPIIIEELQIEEGTVATEYEPYKEYKASVYLNSPLTKFDETCVQNGQLGVLRGGGKVVLDGSEDENWLDSWNEYYGVDGYSIFYTNIDDKLSADGLCEKFINDALSNPNRRECALFKDGGNKAFGIQITNTKLSTPNIVGFKTWLQNNPITVIYELAEPYFEPITPMLPKLVLDSFNDCTLHIDSTIPCQSIKASYTGKLLSVYKLESDISTIEEFNVDMVATNFDMDYRLLEVEWALEDAGITGVNLFNILNTNKGVKSMALTRYEQAKIMIIGGAYNKEVLTKQLTRYLEKKIITQQEYDELIALMEAKELVVG